MLEHVYSHVVILLCVPLVRADAGVLNPLAEILLCTTSSPLTVQLLISGKQRKIAKYYKKQENLLKDFSEMETMNEHGGLDQNGPSEVRVHSTDFLQCSMQKST